MMGEWKRREWIVGALLWVASCAPFHSSGTYPGDEGPDSIGKSPNQITRISEAIEPAIFLIRAGGGTGSAFLFGGPNTVVTNRHVVEAIALNGTVYLRPVVRREDGFTDLGEEVPAELTWKHPDLDLAILTLKDDPRRKPLISAPLEEGRYFRRGKKVLAHGFPSTLSPIVSDGVISGHYRDPRSGATFYLTDAALASGSSGGPITDYDGNLVGMTTALYNFDPGETGFHWGFALPASVIERLVREYQSGQSAPVDVEALLEQIRSAPGTRARIRSLRKAFEKVVNSSGTHRELLENLTVLMGQTRGLVRIQSRKEFDEGLRAVLYMAEVSMRRGFDLARRDVPGSDEQVLKGLRSFIELLTRWHLEMTDDMGLQSSEEMEDLFSTILNIYAESFKDYARRARRACVEFSTFKKGDPTAGRTYEYWSAFTETEMMRRLIVMSGGMSEMVVDAANQIRNEPQFYRLRGALLQLKRAQADVGHVFGNECAYLLKRGHKSSDKKEETP